jgi:hypothetical protein
MKKMIFLGILAVFANQGIQAMMFPFGANHRLHSNLKKSIRNNTTEKALQHFGYDTKNRTFNRPPAPELSLTLEQCQKSVVDKMRYQKPICYGLASLFTAMGVFNLTFGGELVPVTFQLAPLLGATFWLWQSSPALIKFKRKPLLDTYRLLKQAEKAALNYKPTKETL